jgi:hypothetical protein
MLMGKGGGDHVAGLSGTGDTGSNHGCYTVEHNLPEEGEQVNTLVKRKIKPKRRELTLADIYANMNMDRFRRIERLYSDAVTEAWDDDEVYSIMDSDDFYRALHKRTNELFIKKCARAASKAAWHRNNPNKEGK